MEMLAFAAVFKANATQRAIYLFSVSVVDDASYAIRIFKVYF